MPCEKVRSCPCCFGCRREETEQEKTEVIVHMNDREANRPYGYPDNFIKTTSYTVLTFFPLSLLFQFRKLSNMYFLLNMILSLIPGISPFTPLTAVFPLLFVIGVAVLKEAFEEYRRHRADRQANSQEVEVLVDGELKKVLSRHLHAGDVVRLKNGDEVRADIFFLSSSTEEGLVYIDTCSLDGETSLKTRKSIDATRSLCTPEAIGAARLTLHTIPPDPALLLWTGKINLDGAEYAVDLGQFLYRGCVLHKTDWVWGFVIYAGIDTKMFRNLKKRPPKSSDLDRKLNKLILAVFIMQNILLITLSSLSFYWSRRHRSHWYIRWYLLWDAWYVQWFSSYFTYFILFSNLIPISLFVTMEFCKVIQAHWMKLDKEMQADINGKSCHCVANTSNLNEQLAMARYIFTDKTGTLTENVMKFKLGDIRGYKFSGDDVRGSMEVFNQTGLIRDAADEYFLALSICHTVQPFRDDTLPLGLVYEGSSPDEVAFVTTAAECGFRLVERTSRHMTVEVKGQNRIFDILATLHFTPERKMMSIIVRERNTERIILFTKGADSSVSCQLDDAPDTQEYIHGLTATLSFMSETGLRTLIIATRQLTQSEFDSWHQKFVAAGKVLIRRGEVVDKVCMEIERSLRPLGATGIEDKLQDEVPETISFFLKAGVVIWMLTGDKRETALTIAATASLCDPRKDVVVHVDIGALNPKSPEAVDKVGADLRHVQLILEREKQEKELRCTLVIDGLALGIALERFFDLFLEVSKGVSSAICCRLTPLQKANVVRMFQKSTGHTAIAIGDGANDVSMIQEGRVGVGIIGLEGSQAALAADYAIPRFKHLRRLCAVHGRYSLVRNASCITASFYKNFVLSFVLLIFSFYNGFSGLTLVDGWLLTFYNIVMTSIPPFFMGIFEKDLPEEVLERRPDLFTPLSHGLYFNIFVLLRWFLEASIHAFCIFYAMYPTSVQLDYDATRDISGIILGTMTLFVLLCVVLCRFCLHIRYWTWIQVGGITLSFLVFIAFLLLYSIFHYVGSSSLYWHAYVLMSGSKLWLYALLVAGGLIFVVSLPVLCAQKHFCPTPRDIAERDAAGGGGRGGDAYKMGPEEERTGQKGGREGRGALRGLFGVV